MTREITPATFAQLRYTQQNRSPRRRSPEVFVLETPRSACLDHISRIVNIPDQAFMLALLSSLMPGRFQVDPDTSCQRISLRKRIYQHCPKLGQQQGITHFTPKGKGGLSSACQKVRSLFPKQWPSGLSPDRSLLKSPLAIRRIHVGHLGSVAAAETPTDEELTFVRSRGIAFSRLL